MTISIKETSSNNTTNLLLQQLPIERYNINEVQAEAIRLFLENNNIDVSSIKNEIINKFLSTKNDSIYNTLKQMEIKWDFQNLESLFYLQFDKETINKNGIVYTPYYIADYINQNIMKNPNKDSKIIDLSCGSGVFLLSSIKLLKQHFPELTVINIIENNIYGVDILENNIFTTKLLLSLYALISGEDKSYIHFNILCDDILTINLFEQFNYNNINNKFDYVVGNPPYVKIQDLTKKQREVLSSNFFSCKSGSYNLFYAFIELSFKIINDTGKVGYIIPNHLLKMKSAHNLRKLLIENKYITTIIDFRDYPIFTNVQTYSSIILFDCDPKNEIYYHRIPDANIEGNIKDYLKSISFNNLNYNNINTETINLLSNKELRNIHNIESQPFSLKISTGIATQKDSLYLIKTNNNTAELENGKYLLKEFNGELYPIEKEITIPIIKGSGTKRVDSSKDFYDLNRIIYPYEVINDRIEVIDENKMKSSYPKTLHYFTMIKSELNKRNGGNPSTKVWYEYGRSQALGSYIPKIIFPTNSSKPNFVYFDIKALFHNGYAIYGTNNSASNVNLYVLEKILNSSIMDYYIKLTSYMISGGYYCYQKKYVENFTIPSFTDVELDFLEETEDQNEINNFLINKYQLKI